MFNRSYDTDKCFTDERGNHHCPVVSMNDGLKTVVLYTETHLEAVDVAIGLNTARPE